MTTIAVAYGIMCSDNQETNDYGHTYACKKIYKIASGPFKGHIVGTTGSTYTALLFIDWYRAGKVRVPLDPKSLEDWTGLDLVDILFEEDTFECVILTPKGILVTDKSFRPAPVVGDTYTTGSGGSVARGVLDAGGTAESAVEIACLRDTYTSDMGIPLQLLKVANWSKGGFAVGDEGYTPPIPRKRRRKS